MTEKVQVVLISEADPSHPRTLPRNPTTFKDDQNPQYKTEDTPEGAVYQALAYTNSGPRDFDFRITLLPEVDGPEKVTELMQFLFGLVLPIPFRDPRDGVTRMEPPDVIFMYGGMIRRGKVTKRSVTYNHLSQWGVAREIQVDLQLRAYVRKASGSSQDAASSSGKDRFSGSRSMPTLTQFDFSP